MKHVLLILTILLAFVLPVNGENLDSLVLSRVFTYQRNFTHNVNGFSTNLYVKFLYQTNQRNVALWAIPYGHAIANGERNFVSEQYSRVTFRDVDDYENNRQVYYTTIPHNRRTMPTLFEFLTPDLYNVTLYNDHVLSPFNRENRHYYHYNIYRLDNRFVRINFRPRFWPNTQLVTGQALVEYRTGRIEQAELNGEFDMIRFKTLTMQGRYGARALLPRFVQTDIQFKFMGNDISSHFEALYDCPITLPDTLRVKGDRQMIDSVRPIALSAAEQAIYDEYDRRHPAPSMTQAEATADSLLTAEGRAEKESVAAEPEKKKKKKHNYWEEIGWDLIGQNLIRSISTRSDKAELKLFPLLNPHYISYSARKGFAYRMKMGARYRFTPDRYLSFEPQLGYNFKLREFYYTLPLQYTYGRQNNGRVYAKLQKDNRIGNNVVLNEIRQEQGDAAGLEEKDLDLFSDTHFSIRNTVALKPWLTLEAGFIYHHRKAVNAEYMRLFGKPTLYNSLAPLVGVKVRPWKTAPIFSVDYERGLKTKFSDLAYERWEADMSYKHYMTHLQQLNLRFGCGFYTKKERNYFMDFANFRDNNLPEGWDDDWSGNFQLLGSSMYNASDYYLRSNISYESPLLGVSMIPLVGRYVERERAYWNGLSIAHSRIYSEVGYGFTCRYFSMGLFASFLNLEYQRMGCKFTFELFRRW
ncbi:MAG: hypothetical protein IJ544_06280 [Prevotella sp.]|nr:hypothetical protein [Prevotella sp.]